MLSDKLLTLSELHHSAMQSALNERLQTSAVKLLLSELTGLTLPELSVRTDFPLTEFQVSVFWEWFGRLKAHEPVQYIIGKAHFYGLELQVNRNVLIPRPETEGLVEWLVKREKGLPRILDIGTGSGAIALALKNLKPGFEVSATDISQAAIDQAQKNAEILKLNVHFLCCGLFPMDKVRFDIVVSNPPYITEADYAKLDDEIRLFEPKLALLAGEDGLEFYHRILSQAPDFLTPSGKVYLETGELQSSAISRIAVDSGFSKVEVKRDLTGRNRYLCASL